MDKNTILDLERFVSDNVMKHDQGLMDELLMLVDNHCRGSERTYKPKMGEIVHNIPTVASQETLQAYVNSMKKVLKKLLPTMNNLKELEKLYKETPDDLGLNELIEVRISKLIEGDILNMVDEHGVSQEIKKYRVGSVVFKLYENKLISLITPKVDAFIEIGQFSDLHNEYRKYPGVVDLVEKKARSFMSKKTDLDSLIEEKPSFGRGSSIKSIYYEHVFDLVLIDKKRRTSFPRTLMLYDKLRNRSSDCKEFLTGCLGQMVEKRKIKIRSIDNLLTIQKIVKDNGIAQGLLDERKKVLVDKYVDLKILFRALNKEVSLVGGSNIISVFEKVVKKIAGGPEKHKLSGTPIHDRIIDRLKSSTAKDVKVLLQIYSGQTPYGERSVEMMEIVESKLREFLPDVCLGIDSVKKLDKFTGGNSLKYKYRGGGEMPFAGRKRDLISEEVKGKGASVSNFEELASLCESDINFFLGSSIKEYSESISLTQLDADLKIVKDNYVNSALRHCMNQYLSSYNVFELAGVRDKEKYSSVTRSLAVSLLKQKIKKAEFTETWFLYCIQNKVFFGLKRFFVDRTTEILDANKVS